MRRAWKWGMVGWSALMGVWLIAGFSQGSNCDGARFEEACRDGEALGMFAGFVLVLFVWTLGMVLLGVAWRVSKPDEPAAVAGWHPDPTGRARLRWFDGREWTDHIHN